MFLFPMLGFPIVSISKIKFLHNFVCCGNDKRSFKFDFFCPLSAAKCTMATMMAIRHRKCNIHYKNSLIHYFLRDKNRRTCKISVSDNTTRATKHHRFQHKSI
ncbi:hypothetical protein SCA6_014357 [Theobroma cacao]